MIQNTKLARAVALAMTGTALSVGGISTASAAATTMYNLFHEQAGAAPCAPCSNGETDGWVWGGVGTAPPATNTATSASPGFVGIGGSSTPSSSTPFGYTGAAVVNWALEMTAVGDTATISNQDSLKYGHSADIDTAQGAWSDNALAGAQGWRHNLDFGLFRSTVDTWVTLSVHGVNSPSNNQFGFTIMKGMDTNASYQHHGAWNFGTDGAQTPCAGGPPAGGCSLTTADIVASSIGGTTPSNIGTISFHALANQVYTVVLGGYRTGAWTSTTDGYTLSVAAVPIPAAAWLFGSALAGMGIIGRRKEKTLAA